MGWKCGLCDSSSVCIFDSKAALRQEFILRTFQWVPAKEFTSVIYTTFKMVSRAVRIWKDSSGEQELGWGRSILLCFLLIRHIGREPHKTRTRRVENRLVHPVLRAIQQDLRWVAVCGRKWSARTFLSVCHPGLEGKPSLHIVSPVKKSQAGRAFRNSPEHRSWLLTPWSLWLFLLEKCLSKLKRAVKST